MRSEVLITHSLEVESKFPKVMKYKPFFFNDQRLLIVMFIENRKGIILHDSEKASRVGKEEEGFYSCDDNTYWEPFSGDIKLVIDNGK